MASEVQVGSAVIFGITNSGTAISVGGYATFLLHGAEPTHKFRLKEITDANDFDAALVASNAHLELTLDFTPSGSTRAAAASVAVFLTPLASVALANFKVAALNGTWVYVGDEKITLSANDAAKISLPIRKYDDATQNTSLTAAALS